MELKLDIYHKPPGQRGGYGSFLHVSFTDEDLLEWARKYVMENHNFNADVEIDVDVAAIIP